MIRIIKDIDGLIWTLRYDPKYLLAYAAAAFAKLIRSFRRIS